MTDAVVRPEVEEATRLPEDLTIGAMAQWSVRLQRLTRAEPFSGQEVFLVNEQWIAGLMALCEKQGVENLGNMAYIVDSEAQQLLRKDQEK